MSRSVRAALIVCVMIVGAAALLAVAEGAYRYRISRQPAQIRFYRHARLKHALVRDMDYGGVLHINRHGFRGPDFDAAKPAGTTRIIVVGASTTFDTCAPSDAHTWAARLEHWLEELAPDRAFEVINAGMPGFPMIDQVIRLQTELYAFAPDVILVYAGHGIVTPDDAVPDRDHTSRTPDAAESVTPWDSWLTRNSRLYERLSRPEGAARRALPATQQARAAAHAARDFHRELTSFSLIARGFGARVVFAEINRVTGSKAPARFTADERALWQGFFGTAPELVNDGYVRFHDVWQQVADSTGATFIPVDSIGITGPDNFCPGDPIHFNAAGSEAMGRRMAAQLLASDILGP